jgi:hypothetical protein
VIGVVVLVMRKRRTTEPTDEPDAEEHELAPGAAGIPAR